MKVFSALEFKVRTWNSRIEMETEKESGQPRADKAARWLVGATQEESTAEDGLAISHDAANMRINNKHDRYKHRDRRMHIHTHTLRLDTSGILSSRVAIRACRYGAEKKKKKKKEKKKRTKKRKTVASRVLAAARLLKKRPPPLPPTATLYRSRPECITPCTWLLSCRRCTLTLNSSSSSSSSSSGSGSGGNSSNGRTSGSALVELVGGGEDMEQAEESDTQDKASRIGQVVFYFVPIHEESVECIELLSSMGKTLR